MTDFTDDIFRSTPDRLARLMSTSEENSTPMSTEELATAWAGIRKVTIEISLANHDPISSNSPSRMDREPNSDRAEWTYGKLLADPAAPLEALSQLKGFAKINREHPDSALPREIATVLYYASIAAALTKHDQRISSLGDGDLGEGLAWAAEQSWLDEDTRTMLERCIKRLNQPGS